MSAKSKEERLHLAVIGRKTTAILKGVGKQKHEELVTGELISEVTSERIPCSVKKSTDPNVCDISYKPTTLGRHKLHIKVNGEPVRGSPFPVSVSSPTHHTYSTPTASITDIRGPWGVAINQKGDIVVVETKGHCVTTFSSAGNKLQSFQLEYHGHHHHHKLKSPRGVAIDSDNYILVTDYDKHCIHKYKPGGEHVMAVGKEGEEPLEFRNPAGIGIHPHTKKIYVVEYGNHCVQILNSDFTFFNSFGCHGNGNGQFNHPYDVAFGRVGNVFVADYDNHRIQAFTAEGQFLYHIGQWGTGDGDLQNPYSIVIDGNDQLYVTEGGNYRVSKFRSGGEFLGRFGIEKKRLYMNAPCGIAVGSGNNCGTLYVSDYINNCLLSFHTDFALHEVNDA